MLLELENGEHVNQKLFDRLKGLMEESAEVYIWKPSVTLCIRNLDTLTTREKIVEAVNSEIHIEFPVSLTKPNSRE